MSSGPARAEDGARPPQTPSALVKESTAVTKTTPKEPAKAAGLDPTPDAEQAAEAALQRSLATYDAGDIKGAYDQMRESYRLSQRPELFYNLAQMERELHHCQASLEDYHRYLASVPHGTYRQDAEQASRELAQECPPAVAAPQLVAPQLGPLAASRSVVVEPKQSGPERPLTYWTEPRMLAWSAIVAGVLAGGGSLYFHFQALSAREADQKQATDSGKSPEQHDPVLQNRLHRDNTWTGVLGVTGGALVAGGVLVLVLNPHAPSRASARIDGGLGGFEACFSHSF